MRSDFRIVHSEAILREFMARSIRGRRAYGEEPCDQQNGYGADYNGHLHDGFGVFGHDIYWG